MKKETRKQKFDLLSNREKRVLIAKDVIKWIRSGMLRPGTGGYLNRGDFIRSGRKSTDEICDLLLEGKVKNCHVCAKGAMFLADIIRRDNFTVADLGFYFNSNIPRVNYFTEHQKNLIETAFEGSNYCMKWDNDKDEFKTSPLAGKAINFSKIYKKSEDRLIAIMKNIIKNNGTFKP